MIVFLNIPLIAHRAHLRKLQSHLFKGAWASRPLSSPRGRPSCAALVCCALAFLFFVPLLTAQTTIDLKKPVSESLKPDVLYWSLDGGTVGHSEPAEVEDGSGNGFTGKLRSGKIHPEPVYAPGKFGTALRFHGVTPPVTGEDGLQRTADPSSSIGWRVRDTPDVPDLQKFELAGKSFTAGLWIKLEKINEGESQSVFLMNWGTSPASQWSFILVKDQRDEWIMRMLRTKSVGTRVLSDGAWHHVAFSLEAKEGEILVTYWLDGEILGEPVTNPAVIAESQSVADQIFQVGERNVANFSTGFAGLLDDVFVTSGVHTFQP